MIDRMIPDPIPVPTRPATRLDDDLRYGLLCGDDTLHAFGLSVPAVDIPALMLLRILGPLGKDVTVAEVLNRLRQLDPVRPVGSGPEVH